MGAAGLHGVLSGRAARILPSALQKRTGLLRRARGGIPYPVRDDQDVWNFSGNTERIRRKSWCGSAGKTVFQKSAHTETGGTTGGLLCGYTAAGDPHGILTYADG